MGRLSMVYRKSCALLVSLDGKVKCGIPFKDTMWAPTVYRPCATHPAQPKEEAAPTRFQFLIIGDPSGLQAVAVKSAYIFMTLLLYITV